MSNAGREVPWINEIATKAECSPGHVEAFLIRHKVRASPVLPRPRSMTLRALRFSGQKAWEANAGPYRFSWEDLGLGLWGLGAAENFAGKSSILEITKWLIRGSPPKSLQGDVQKAVSEASLDFDIDAECYSVSFSAGPGAFNGHLSMAAGETEEPRTLATLASEADFREAMADLMLRTFALDTVVAWHKDPDSPDGGRGQEQGWPALSGALAIGTEYKALLGDVTADGLAGRMVNMFIGLPWIPTLSTAVTAMKAVAAARDQAGRGAAEEAARREARLTELRSELAAVQARLAGLPTADDVLAKGRQVAAERGRTYRDIAAAEGRVAEFERRLHTATDAYNEDKSALLDFQEQKDAGFIFAGLEPECCPRCDITFGKQRLKREREGGGCMVCGDPSSLEAEDPAVKERMLFARAEASRKAVNSENAALGRANAALTALEARRLELETEAASLAAAEGQAAIHQGVLLDERVIAAKIEEASRPVARAASGPTDLEVAISEAVEAVTRKRATALQNEILGEVSREIVSLANRFGMGALSEATLRGNGTLSLVKGGVQTNFSSVTVGEKLRLKVATAIAILAVGTRRGVGRHPGVLLIDSPGAQEMKGDNLDALFGGLAELSREMPRLQLIVATTQLDFLRRAIPKERLKLALENGRMW